ncbi:cadherin-86C isoform X3 [Anopheles stephensi]|uniref:cadherin-86C isoform X3 n=1 Tax=Anopheles stephensi TaxID=30069 RepID=UPI001658BAB6|nr:cadherin-86C isoform X3 [Anopheles stephensi]
MPKMDMRCHKNMTSNGVTCEGAYSSTSGRRKRICTNRLPLTLALLALVSCWPEAAGLDPKFDPSTRMRLVLVPADATVGSVIYRLRASDEEFEYPLQFELVGDASSSTVQIETLPCTKFNSICQANVILTRRLEPGRYYDFQVSVKDTKGGMSVQSCSITATNFTTPHDIIFPHKAGIIMVPEDAKKGTELDYVLANKNPLFQKPVYLELWGSPLFGIRQKFISPETAEGTIFLLGQLDFEKQAMYHLTVLANDAYAEPGQDTRNIAGLEVVVIVEDVQDVPPVFTVAPPVTRLPAGLIPGDKVLQVHAEDGDKGVPREIRYGLVSEGNPFTSFFDINETSGEISLLRPLDDILALTHAGDPVLLTVIAEEVKVSRDEPPAMATTVQLAFFLPERSNSPPYFENDHYVARLEENAAPGTVLAFTDPYTPRVMDDDAGKNGVFSLTLLGNNGTFEISPNVAEGHANFVVRVRDNTRLDYETATYVHFQILAQELGPATNLSTLVNVTVYLADVNDNAPVFEQNDYIVDLPENMTAGTRVVQVHATDVDTAGLGGRVRYTQILGPHNTSLNLDPASGVVTVAINNHGFDREAMPEYHLYVEARDDDGIGNRAQVPLVIRLIDVNDETPTFEKPLYEFILAADLRNFTVPAFIRATDGDAEAPNNEVRYELIYGNYENKFFLHPITGELKLNAPLVPRTGSQSQSVGGLRRRRQTAGGLPPNLASTGTTSQQQQKESDVFVLTARAFDLGVPVRYSTATIRVYPPESRTRTVTFIVPGSDPDRKKVQDTLADITGGRVIIQEVRPYRTGDGGIPTDLIGAGGGGGGGSGNERSVVIATILYDADSVVDIAKIQQRLSINGTVTNIISQEERSAILYKAENRVLFWLLIFLAILLALGILTLLLCCICPRCPLNATNRSDMKNKSTKDDAHMHRSRTNLLNADRDMYVEDVDEHDPEYQSLKRIHHHHHHHHGGAGNGGKPVADDVLPIDDDSMRRHEMDRGSDLNYERRGSFKRQGHAAPPQLVAHGDDIEPRDQYFIKDGNAEILRLITRGRNEEENIYVNIPQQQQQQRPGAANQPQYIMVDNGGKEILMRRYIEEQANGKQIIREHYQLLPGTTFIQTIPNEVPVRRGEHVTEVKIGAAQAGRSKMGGEQGENEDGGRLKPAVSTHSLMHQELEHSLKQQNALLRQILLEKEKLEERYNQYEQALETQSLPCQSMAVVVAATQTDCDTGTQTDPVRAGGPNGGLGRRRTKSENDDSLSEDEYEYVRYSPPDSPDGVYLIKRRRHRKKTKHRVGKGSFSGEHSGGESTGERKSNRRIIVVESVKRKIRTPIQEEDDELVHHGQHGHGRDGHHGQGSHRRGGQETRTSILRRKRNEELSRGSNGNGHGSTSNGKDHRLKRDVLMEISDSLHGEQSRGGGRRSNGAGAAGENRRKKVYRKNVKYYEDSDGSEKEVVVQKNYFSADSLDEITSDVEDYRYSVTKTSKSVTVSPKASVEQRISRRDDKTETTTTRIRLTTSESPSRRQSTGPTVAPPPPKGPAPKPPRMSKSLSKEEGLNETTAGGEQHAVNPKYMDWYYNLGKDADSLEKREGRKRQEQQQQQQPAVGTTTLTTTTTSSTTTITTGGSRKKPDMDAGAKGKPEPAPRTSPPKEARLLKEDIQHARKVQQQTQSQQQQHPGSEAGNSHPLLQHSEHRYEAEYGTGPQVPAPPDKLPHYLYPETPPIVSRDNKVQIKIVDSSAASTGPQAPQTAAKPAAGGTSTKPTNTTGTNAKTLNVSTLEDDHDSGIAMNSLLHTKGKRNKIADKKSIFTIAYDDVRIRQIRSESDTPPFS